MAGRLLWVAVLAAAFGVMAAGSALADAGGQGTVTMTTHDHNVLLFSMPVTNPCTNQTGTLMAVAANEVFHVTQFTAPGADEFWVTGTAEGTATFTPDNLSGVSASGHFMSWFGESSNNQNDVQHDTNTFQLFGTDGSHTVVQMTDHLSTNANGDVTVSFSNFKFHCS